MTTIPAPLLDRMEIIDLSSYTELEKISIAKNHLIPKQREGARLTERRGFRSVTAALVEIIRSYTREAGVRELERKIATVFRKCALSICPAGKKTEHHRDKEYRSLDIFGPTDSIHRPNPIQIDRGGRRDGTCVDGCRWADTGR